MNFVAVISPIVGIDKGMEQLYRYILGFSLGREESEILDIYYRHYHYIDSDGILVISQDMAKEYALSFIDWHLCSKVLRRVSGCEYYKIDGLNVKGVRFF